MRNPGGWPDRPTVKFKRLPHGEGLPLPAYATDRAAGMDLYAAVPIVLSPGEWWAVSTGLQIEIAPGFEGQVRPRSGLSFSTGLTVLNAPGTIDADYRGEVKVILINHGRLAKTVHRGDRIAQLVIAPVSRARIEEVDTLSETARGEGGFGSTGVR